MVKKWLESGVVLGVIGLVAVALLLLALAAVGLGAWVGYWAGALVGGETGGIVGGVLGGLMVWTLPTQLSGKGRK